MKYCAVYQPYTDPIRGSHHPDDASFPHEYEEIEADSLEEAEKLARSREVQTLTGGRAFISIKPMDG